jgi:hypothetical protein
MNRNVGRTTSKVDNYDKVYQNKNEDIAARNRSPFSTNMM